MVPRNTTAAATVVVAATRTVYLSCLVESSPAVLGGGEKDGRSSVQAPLEGGCRQRFFFFL